MCSYSSSNTCGDCGVATKKGYVEILEFTHFVEFFSFNKIGENHKEKELAVEIDRFTHDYDEILYHDSTRNMTENVSELHDLTKTGFLPVYSAGKDSLFFVAVFICLSWEEINASKLKFRNSDKC